MRFLEEGGAQKAVSGLKATAGAGEGEKPELCGGECDVRVVEGEEEEEYWGRVAESRLKKLAPRRGAWRGEWRKGAWQGGERGSDARVALQVVGMATSVGSGDQETGRHRSRPGPSSDLLPAHM